MSQTKQIKSEGKYSLLNFVMSTPSRNLDLGAIATTCDIYESILSPTAVMVFSLYDATGVFDKINFVDQEVCISFTTNEAGKEIHYKMKVIECNPAKTTEQGKGVVFTLTAVSEEAFKSRTLKDNPLVRKKMEASTIVNAYLELMKSEKPRFLEKTKGLHAINMTNITPMEAIDKVRKNALSAKYDGHAFVFFENKNGLHFKSIEKLIEEGKDKVGDKYFINTPTGKLSTSSGSNWRNILGYKTIQNGNKNVLLATGGSKVRVQALNMETFEITELVRTSKDFNFLKLNEKTNRGSSKVQEEISKDTGRVIQLLVNPEEEENQIIDKLAAEACYMSEFLSVINHITIYGDSEITAGDVIKCDFKEQSGLTKGDNAHLEDNTLLSGKYLVTKCRHVLTFGDTPEYYQALEIVKDGTGSELEPTKG